MHNRIIFCIFVNVFSAKVLTFNKIRIDMVVYGAVKFCEDGNLEVVCFRDSNLLGVYLGVSRVSVWKMFRDSDTLMWRGYLLFKTVVDRSNRGRR